MDLWNDQEFRLEQLLPLIQEQLAAGKSVKFSPRGTSMLPMLRQGIDSVLLSPAPQRLKRFDLPLYRRRSGQFVLHRVVSVSDCYTCIGDNQFVYECGIRHDQVVGVVTAFWRGERKIKTHTLPYRLYCHVWHLSRPLRQLWRGAVFRLRKILFNKKPR